MSDKLRLKGLPDYSFQFITEEMITCAHLSAEQAVALEELCLEDEYSKTNEELRQAEWKIDALDTIEGIEIERSKLIAVRDDAMHALDELCTELGIERTTAKLREELESLRAENMKYEIALESLQEWRDKRQEH